MAETATPAVLALVSDMIFESKIGGTGRAAGVSVKTVRTPAALLSAASAGGAAMVLVDLNVTGSRTADVIAGLRRACGGVRIIGFASHVDADLLEQARLAGADEVMPRSRFDADLAAILATGPAGRRS